MLARIRNDIKVAMREKNIIKKDVLKMILLKSEEIAKEDAIKNKKDLAKIHPTDEMVIDACNKELKQLNQTKDILVSNGKEDSELYKETIEKISIVTSYLPKQLSEEELKEKIRELISGIEDKSNKGLIMKTVMSNLKGKADGKIINSCVQEVLRGI